MFIIYRFTEDCSSGLLGCTHIKFNQKIQLKRTRHMAHNSIRPKSVTMSLFLTLNLTCVTWGHQSWIVLEFPSYLSDAEIIIVMPSHPRMFENILFYMINTTYDNDFNNYSTWIEHWGMKSLCDLYDIILQTAIGVDWIGMSDKILVYNGFGSW